MIPSAAALAVIAAAAAIVVDVLRETNRSQQHQTLLNDSIKRYNTTRHDTTRQATSVHLSSFVLVSTTKLKVRRYLLLPCLAVIVSAQGVMVVVALYTFRARYCMHGMAPARHHHTATARLSLHDPGVT